MFCVAEQVSLFAAVGFDAALAIWLFRQVEDGKASSMVDVGRRRNNRTN